MRDRLTRLTEGVPLPRILATYGMGLLGGIAAEAARLPLGMLLGSLLVTASLAMSGRHLLGGPVFVPQKWRFVLIPVIGVAIGAAFTPDILSEAPRWGLSLAMLALFLPLAHAIGHLVYSRLGGLDRRTAFFSAVPGGLYESIQLGEQAGADIQMLTMLQFLRLILCILLVPIAFTIVTGAAVGSASGIRIAGAEVPLGLQDAAVLLGAAVAGVWLGERLRLPAANIFGPLILSAAAHLTGLTQTVPPDWLILLTQLVVGTGLGTRFAGMKRARLGQALRLATLNMALALGLAWGFALALATLTGMPAGAVFLAYAPGGVAEMSLVALSLQVSMVYVTVHHVLRIVLSVFIVQIAHRHLR